MYLLLFIAGPATYLLRASFLLLAKKRPLPTWLADALALLPAAILAAVVVQSLALPEGALDLSPRSNPHLLVGLLLFPLAWWLRRRWHWLLVLTLGLGMGLLWLLHWWLG